MRRITSGYQPTKSTSRSPKTDRLEPSNPYSINFTPITVSCSFRDQIGIELPGLKDHKAYWRMLQYLLFGSWRDEESGELLIPRELLAAMEDKICDANYSAIRFLEQFSKDVGIALDIENYILAFSADLCKPRRIKGFSVSDNVRQLVAAERCSTSTDRVFMDSGNKWLRKHSSEQRQLDYKQAEENLALCEACADSQALCHYLNNLPPNRFSSTLKHIPEAIEAARTLKDAENQLNILKSIRDQAQPFYATAQKSVRIFPIRDSILRLHRDLRKIMTQNWTTADLKSAQLAVVAKVWEVPEIADYLQSGRSIWRDLCDHMGLDFDDENKAMLKTALYAITFGAGKKKMHAYFSRFFDNGRGVFAHFKQHPIIHSMLRARSSQLRKIRSDRGGTDAFGRFTPLVKMHKQGYDYEFDNSRSILACIAQSYELKILMPVVQLAVAEQFNDHGFSLTTFLHDGFTFDVFRKQDQQIWQDRLKALVDDEASELGIHTSLEFS